MFYISLTCFWNTFLYIYVYIIYVSLFIIWIEHFCHIFKPTAYKKIYRKGSCSHISVIMYVYIDIMHYMHINCKNFFLVIRLIKNIISLKHWLVHIANVKIMLTILCF